MLDYISKNILRHPQVSFSLQVTEGKQDLEKALSLSQKFQKESAALQEWLTTNEAQLQQKNGCEDMPADIDAEIAWANVSKRKPSKATEKCFYFRPVGGAEGQYDVPENTNLSVFITSAISDL